MSHVVQGIAAAGARPIDRALVRRGARNARLRPEVPGDWSAPRTAIVALLVFLGCYLGAAAGTHLVLPVVETAILFPPYAVLTAALLLAPVRRWWVIVLAAALGDFWPHQEFEGSWSIVLIAEAANAIRGLVVAGGLRLVLGRVRLDTLRGTAIFLAFAGLLGPALAAFVGASNMVLHGRASDFWLAWRAWALSNALTGLTLLPLLLAVAGQPVARLGRAAPERILEASALFLGLLLVGYLGLAGSHGSASLPAGVYAPVPFLLWAAVRFGPGGTIAALSVVTGFAVVGATTGRGPFLGQSPAENLLQLQFFLIAVTVPMLFLGATVRQLEQAAVAWRRSQAEYRSVVEDQTELICRFLPDGTYTFVNGAYGRYFRRSAEHLLGRSFWQFVPPEEHGAIRAVLDSITPDRPVASLEHLAIAPGGELRWHEWTNRGLFDAQGRIVEYQSVGRDVTDRKRTEERIRLGESQLRMFVEHAPAAVAMFDRDMRYVVYSRRWLTDYKLGEQDLVGRSHYDVFPEIPERWKEIHRRCLTGAVAQDDADPFHRRDGTTDWIHWEVRPWHHADGSIGGVIMFTEVITARKLTEEETALRQSEERFRTLADDAPVLIWMSGLRNEAVYFNKPWLSFTGRTIEDELGSGWAASIHPDDRKRCVELCDEAFARRERISIQFRLRRHDGAYRWVLDHGIPRFGADGEFAGYVGSCVDITERQLADEALQEAGHRKDEFLAMLGHELRNPLAPIAMAVEVMRRSSDTDESTVWARDVISRQVGQLTRLVDDLLDISRITRGKIRLKMSRIDLGLVVMQAVETSRPLIGARKHGLTVDLPSDPLPMRGDDVRLAQAVSNLLNNAAKYTDVGGRIALALKRDDGHAVLTVADNGPGIPAEMLESVFDLFAQIEGTDDRSQGGLGIGLTLVKRLVEMHDGTIEVRSEGRGLGSEFVVRLPLAAGAQTFAEGEEDPSPIELPVEIVPRSTVRKRILIVDDNVDAAEGLSRLLGLEHHEVLVAHDGLEALAANERMHPDVVLLDIGLPRLDGLEVARRIRKASEGSPPLLVATTGFDQAKDRHRIAEAGFDHHLIKPLDPGVLRSLVQAARAR